MAESDCERSHSVSSQLGRVRRWIWWDERW